MLCITWQRFLRHCCRISTASAETIRWQEQVVRSGGIATAAGGQVDMMWNNASLHADVVIFRLQQLLADWEQIETLKSAIAGTERFFSHDMSYSITTTTT